MAKESVTVHWLSGMTSTVVPIDALGIGTFDVPKGRSEFILMGGPRVGEEPYRIAYLNCNETVGQTIQVARVIEKGIVPANTCGRSIRVQVKSYSGLSPSHGGNLIFNRRMSISDL
jgi:hypothetical protein